ncbi:MAG: Gfo/Idh/MocA family oxidoreductase [Planctomycetota bacterium]|jgi:predicted dehydrogenase|nr:Gfo/Idh/MocA family oxidoreductase [Planctomycetota bacterium]
MAKKKPVLNVALVGYSFMGRAHSNAWNQAEKYFDLPYTINRQVIIGRNQAACQDAADNWGWANTASSLEQALEKYDIDVVDITVPNVAHAEITMQALKAGKHVFCEKPLGMNSAECKKVTTAAEKAGVHVGVWHNYRRAPAAGLAYELIAEGRIGEVRQIRAVYLQDWLSDSSAPASGWRLNKAICGSGSHGDLGAHLIDTCRYLTGLEFDEVSGMTKTFTEVRPNESGKGKVKIDVDDATCFLARMSNGAIATFEATRTAPGHKNYNVIEINGTKGSIIWNFERMNELQFFTFDDIPHAQGFRTIMCMDGGNHPYAGQYWPDGHIIGYEHTFINTLADFLVDMKKRKALSPSFHDGWANQEVLDAVLKSADSRKWVSVKRVMAPRKLKASKRKAKAASTIA